MKIEDARILLTGASGGLGRALARQLYDSGAHLLLVGRDRGKLAALQVALGRRAAFVAADLGSADGIAAVATAARDHGIDILINNAGVSAFGLLDEQPPAEIERVLVTNLLAPIALTRALLPHLKSRPAAAIVNIGSAFGSIPFAGLAAYSASKAGLRGFSTALRRELADTSVKVIHLAPRAIDTPLNSVAVIALNRALKNRSDAPAAVAAQIVTALRTDTRERHFGFPERFFAWFNGTAPLLVDHGLAAKLSTIKRHASSSH